MEIFFYLCKIFFHPKSNILNKRKKKIKLSFNHNFFLVLNLALGGNFGGPIDPAFTNATMEVDYIRIYK